MPAVESVGAERELGNFSLALDPSAVSLSPGQSASSTITITRTGGFNLPVSLTVEGLPNGVTVALDPGTVAGAQAVLTLTASNSVTAATISAVVRGAATGLAARTATLNVAIQ